MELEGRRFRFIRTWGILIAVVAFAVAMMVPPVSAYDSHSYTRNFTGSTDGNSLTNNMYFVFNRTLNNTPHSMTWTYIGSQCLRETCNTGDTWFTSYGYNLSSDKVERMRVDCSVEDMGNYTKLSGANKRILSMTCEIFNLNESFLVGLSSGNHGYNDANWLPKTEYSDDLNYATGGTHYPLLTAGDSGNFTTALESLGGFRFMPYYLTGSGNFISYTPDEISSLTGSLPEPATVHLVVLDINTGLPIPNSTMSIYNLTTSTTGGNFSLTTGSTTANLFQPAQYRYTGSASGYADNTMTGNITGTGEWYLVVPLTPITGGGDCLDTLIEIKDASTGNLIGSSTLNLTNLTSGWSSVSTAWGGNHRTCLKYGNSFWIGAIKSGYVSQGPETGGLPNWTIFDSFEYGGTLPYVLDLYLVPYRPGNGTLTLFILVRDPDSYHSINGATVKISHGGTIDAVGSTSSEGSKWFTGLDSYTEYLVEVSKSGYTGWSTTFNASGASYYELTASIHVPYATPTPSSGTTPAETIDSRTSSQKASDAKKIWYDNAEIISTLIFLAVLMGLIDMMSGKKRGRK